jgi:zinc protease
MRVSTEALERLGVRFVRESSGIAEYTLTSNGLKILFLKHHLAPVVTTMIMYRVGSRNEGVGYTGSTHFLEHMMFKSTHEHDSASGTGFVDMLKHTGADYNAYTGTDSTSYVICLPKEKLGLALALEADRMRNLKLREDERISEMTVVRSEFEIGENDIDDVMSKQLMAIAYAEHSYHHPIIGWRDDVEFMPLIRMQEFYDTFYWPDNATLIVSGDFDAEEALNLVHSSFGKIPRAPRPIPTVYTREPRQCGARSFELKREGMDNSKLVIGFPIPAATDPDHHVLALIEDILGGADQNSSRLYNALIEPNLALECSSDAAATRDPNMFTINVTLNGYEKGKLAERAIHAELERLKRKPVGQRELARLKRANRNRAADHKSDPMKHADTICDAEAIADWTWTIDYDDKYDAVTSADIMRVARQYFDIDTSTTGRTVKPNKPRRKKSTVDTTVATRATNVPEGFVLPNHSGAGASIVAQGAVVKPTNIAEKVEKFMLANGLKVLILPAPGTGIVSVSGAIRAGSMLAGSVNSMVPELTAKMLKAGSWGLGKREIANRLDAIGCELGFAIDDFAVTFDSTFMSESVDDYLTLLGTVVRQPRFAPAELRRCKNDTVAEARANKGESSVAGTIKLMQTLYPRKHLFYRQSLVTEEKHSKLTNVKDVRDFHAKHYSPRGTVLVIVGDVQVDQLKERLEAVFGDWKGNRPSPIIVPSVQLPEQAKRINVPMPGKSSVDIIIGVPLSLKKSDSEFAAVEIANAALGIDTLSSRLGVAVRTKYGLTYGVTSTFDDARFGQAAWLIQLSVNPDNVEKALTLVGLVVDDFIKNGITERELADEAGRLYGQHVVSLRTTSGLADTLCSRELRGAPLRNLDREWKRLHSVTVQEVNDAMRKHLRFDKAVTVVVGGK